MKSSLLVGVASLFLVLVCTTAWTDEPRLKVKVDVGGASRVGDADKVQVDMTYRSSTITGMPIKNREGDNLGHIEDMVIGLRSGEVRYVALSFGGFAGFRDKLFAVPWDELALHVGETDKYFAIDMNKEKLAKAPGFDQQNWPNTADPNWAGEIDEFYAQSNTEKEPADREERAFRAEGSAHDTGHRIGKIAGLSVKNPEDKELGHIEELVIDLNTGKVRYAALAFGQTLGFGGKLFAVPWDVLSLKEVDDKQHFVLNVRHERLKESPGFDKDNWPVTADMKWRDEIDQYYEAETKESRKEAESIEKTEDSAN